MSCLIPAEWAPQKRIYTAWPAHKAEWDGDLESPRRDVAAMIKVLAAHHNTVCLLVHDEEAERSAQKALGNAASLIRARYGDVWLRDTGPIFAYEAHKKVALCFKTNSWGGKYDLPDDAGVGDGIAAYAGTPIKQFDWVLEGGAIEHDGLGTVLTTRQTLLNPNRNGWSKEEAEAALQQACGAKKIIWIDEGLLNDHTDGHIDNIARFVAPHRVVCQSPAHADDPNAIILNTIAKRLESATDAAGQTLQVIRIPGVGLYKNKLGAISPASYMNFVIANQVVVVPTYGTASEATALAALQNIFKERVVVGVPSQGLLGAGAAGGGSFHCITQQEPL